MDWMNDRSAPLCSNPAQQKQDQQDAQNQAQPAAGIVTPIPAVWPGGERAKQQENEENH
jgi:hypothetical protein